MSSVFAPLGTPAFYNPSLSALKNATNDLGASTARLASGNRIINIGDDVAAFSISASLQSQLSGLKQGVTNVAQGSSLLQVAAGGLQQINTLLDSMKAVAIQGNNTALTDTQRGFLQQQFNAYKDEIDSIASSTTFNSINLLDGTLAGTNELAASTTTATKASATLSFNANVTAGQTIILNNVTLTEGVDFAAGGTTALSVAAILSALSSSTNAALSKATYEASGTTAIEITARTGGAMGNQYFINQADSTASFTTTGGATSVANKYTLTGGADDGLHVNSTTATGTIGNNVINTQAQTPASVTLTLSGAVANNETLLIDNGYGGNVTFTFKTSASSSSSTEIQIGSTTEETLQNAVSKLSQYSASNDYGVRQLTYAVSGNGLVITNRTVGNATETDGTTALAISETIGNGSLSAASFNNGVNTGVDVSGITNPDFLGTISGFTATYIGADNVTASITIGDVAYTASITDTTPAGNTTVRFTASEGDYFDIQLAGGNGTTVANQTNANTYAGRLDAAFAGLTFLQDRTITDFNATDDFTGAKASIKLSDFSTSPVVSAISVTAPSAPGNDGTIDITVNGDTFRANTGLRGYIGAYETVTFTNQSNSSETLTLVNGSTVLDFSSAGTAATAQDALRSAFNIGVDSIGSDFRVGPGEDDIINVAIGSATTDALFNGATLSVSSQANAIAAQTLIDTATNTVQSALANVAALESVFTFASANLTQQISGVGAANSALADTDIVAESTNLAQNSLRVNAAVAVLAQAMSLSPSLIGLLQVNNN